MISGYEPDELLLLHPAMTMHKNYACFSIEIAYRNVK